MPQGKVKWFSAEKAYGFIEQENDNDIFVHVTGLAEGVTALDKDQLVEYEVEQGRKGPQATKVRPSSAAQAPAQPQADEPQADDEPQAEPEDEAETQTQTELEPEDELEPESQDDAVSQAEPLTPEQPTADDEPAVD